jgi:predicted nucleic acid-binding protein
MLVDTSAWSLALRRDQPPDSPIVRRLRRALERGEELFTTGLVLQELLQGLLGPRQRRALLERFNALPFLVPTREDHVDAAALRNRCRARGIQLATIDALLAQLCIRRNLELLTADHDFKHAARHVPLRLAATE